MAGGATSKEAGECFSLSLSLSLLDVEDVWYLSQSEPVDCCAGEREREPERGRERVTGREVECPEGGERERERGKELRICEAETACE